MEWQRPLFIVSWVLLILGAGLGIFSYLLKNRDNIKNNGGGVRGFASVLVNDVKSYRKYLRKRAKAREEQREAAIKKQRSSGGGSGDNPDKQDAAETDGVQAERARAQKKESKRRKKKNDAIISPPSVKGSGSSLV